MLWFLRRWRIRFSHYIAVAAPHRAHPFHEVFFFRRNQLGISAHFVKGNFAFSGTDRPDDTAIFCGVAVLRLADKIDDVDFPVGSRYLLNCVDQFVGVIGGWASCEASGSHCRARYRQRTKRDERNIRDCALFAVNKKTGLPHLRQRLRLPVCRGRDRAGRRCRDSHRKRGRGGVCRHHRLLGRRRIERRFGNAINFDLFVSFAARNTSEHYAP